MEKLTSAKALSLLTEEIIVEASDYQKRENRWILHCIRVGHAARRIAERLGLDADYAEALGYIHDIGRRINHPTHPIEGYYYMQSKGYVVESGICLTHSFINNDICMTAGVGPKGEINAFLDQYLRNHPVTVYDNIIQLCDLFCEWNGYLTIEKRLLDITKRKGVTEHSKQHFLLALQLQKEIETKMGCTMPDLFPEIANEDLENKEKDYDTLLSIIEETNKNKVKKVVEG